MTSECHLTLKILLEEGEWSQSQGGSLGSLFSPPHLRTKNWLVLGSGTDLAQEQVTRSTALSLRPSWGWHSPRHSGSPGSQPDCGLDVGSVGVYAVAVHSNGPVDRF